MPSSGKHQRQSPEQREKAPLSSWDLCPYGRQAISKINEKII